MHSGLNHFFQYIELLPPMVAFCLFFYMAEWYKSNDINNDGGTVFC